MNFPNIKSFLFENHTLKQTIIKNAFWLTFAEVAVKIISFFLFIWFARYFGPEDYGKLTFALSFVALFAFFVDFGFSTVVSREIAKDDSKTSQYVSSVLIIESILGVLTFLAMVLLTLFLKRDPITVWLIYVLGISTILDSITLFLQAVFCGKERMEYVAASKIIQGLVSLGIIFFLIFSKKIGLVGVGYAYITASLISMLSALFMVRMNGTSFSIKIDIAFWKKVLKESWPIGLISFSALIFQSFDSIIIGITRTSQEVGLYNASSRVVFGTYFVLGILFSIFLPPISRAFKNNDSNLSSIVRKYALFIFGFGLPLGVGGFIVSEELIGLLYGSAYSGSVLPFKILSLSLILIFAAGFYGHCLIFFNKQKLFLKANLIGLTVNLFLNIVLIPKFGIVGASIVAVITQMCILLISYLEFRKMTQFKILDILLLLSGSSFLMGLFVIILIKIFYFGVIASILGGVLFYAVLIVAIFLRGEIKLFFSKKE